MLELMNVYNRNDISIIVKYEKEELEFVIKSIVNKRNKEELDPEHNMDIINGYIEYKGEKFKKELFLKYKECYAVLENSIMQADVYPLPIKATHDILDMFDYEDVYLYIRDVYKLTPPLDLKESFDTKTKDDKLWTRVQTYLKDDYLQLAALATVLKSLAGPIGQYGYIKSGRLGKLHKEYILFNIIKRHSIYSVEPFLKLHGLIEAIIKTTTKGEGDMQSDIRVIEKQIPKEDLTIWILSVVVLQKVIISPVRVTPDGKHIVNRVYTFVRNKLAPRGDVGNVIRPKKPMLDESGGEEESVIEAFRLSETLPAGFIMEMIWSVEDIDSLKNELCPELDEKLFSDSLDMANRLDNITSTQVYLMGWVVKNILDSRTLHYIPLENLKPLFGLVFAYLWSNNYKFIAILLMSNYIEDEIVRLSVTSNRSQIPKELKEQLNEFYPYNKIVVSAREHKEHNLAEKSITKLADNIYKGQWLTVVTTNFLKELSIEKNTLSVPGNIKVLLTELLIFVEKRNEV